MIDVRDDDHLDALLREALGRAGEPAPFEVDVADTVMARVAAIGPARKAELEWPQLVRWTIAASVAGLVLLVSAAVSGPSFNDLALDLGKTTAETAKTAAVLSEPAETVAGFTARSAAAMWDSARTLAAPLGAMRPLAQLSLALLALGMIGFSTIVIGRDLRVPATRKEPA
jgi:hypothetical protein